MSTFLPRLTRFLRRPWRDKWLLVQAYVLLGATRFAINTIPTRRLMMRYGAYMQETPETAVPSHLHQAQRVSWAVRGTSRYTPWRSNCYPQALAARLLLHRRDIPSTLYFGAAFTQDKSAMEAHAWLRCGPLFVTGGPGHEQFGTLASFADFGSKVPVVANEAARQGCPMPAEK